MVLASATVVAGCGLLAGAVPGPGFQGGLVCSEMSGGACQEQLERATARHPGATQVEVTCTDPVCDRKGGAGTVVITLPTGARVREVFTYAGDPNPLPVPACTGLAPDLCRSLATSTVDELPPSKAIRAISIACTASSCTQDRGETQVMVRFADGSDYETSTGWEAQP
jgi:hypothetical protein